MHRKNKFKVIFLILTATCLRDGVEVQKSAVKCEIKTGCKLIQKTGECCPEYQCRKFDLSLPDFFNAISIICNDSGVNALTIIY